MRFAFLLVLLAATPAAAHQTSIKYIDLVVHDRTVDITLRCAPTDLTAPMKLPADAKPTAADALRAPDVPHYVQRWLVLARCTASEPTMHIADAKFVAVMWTATCASTRELELDFSAFFALDKRHEAFVQLVAPGVEPVQTIVRANETKVTLRPGTQRALAYWVRDGIGHILDIEAKDHICFVLALLFVVMLYRGAGTWHTRAFVPTLRSTALVITAFTIAHSISLIAAALGLVSLSPPLVESLIALSIAYTALEDIVRPDVRWRYWLTFGFGLVHGLGFASRLAVQLPPHDVVVPLVCFNVGVEVGQLAIVVIALPALFFLARRLGGDRYRKIALPILAGAVFLLGIAMFAERALEVRFLPM